VRRGRIEAIGPMRDVSIPWGATEVRLDGKWIIPGLIDSHTHAERWTLTRFLAYGVTSIRDVGGTLDSIITLRDAATLGSILGPRMYVAGAMIDGSPATYPNAIEVTTPAEAREAIDRLTLLDVTHAKVYTKIDARLLQALLEEATTLNVPVTGHLGRVSAVTAARMGIHAIEHLTGIVEATAANPGRYLYAHDRFFPGWNLTERTWTRLDSANLDHTARTLIEHGVTIVPTLALHEAYSRLTDASYVDRLDLAGVPDSVLDAWNVPDLVRRAGLTVTDFRDLRRARPYQDRFVRMYHRLGGLVAAGTDAPNQLLPPGASLHDEMALLVRAGLTPQDAILTATRNAARLIGVDSVGVLREGSAADFVILNANPIENIEHVREIDQVVLRGVMHRPSELLETR
jgi:imidazolonepropionase-like amidohydrolase